jgi:transcriptional regulator with XRE-family HTH domain
VKLLNDLDQKQKQILLLQQNLSSIRKIAGWTTEQLGEQIGVTKQTISNLENSKTPMSLTQYITIRSILDFEIESNPENTVLPQVINILVDKGTDLEEENYSEIKDTVDTVAASAAIGKKGAPLEKTFVTLLMSPSVIGSLAMLGVILSNSGKITDITNATVSGTANWLRKILK